MARETSNFRAYTEVQNLTVGTTVVNLGIVKAIYPNQEGGFYKIAFSPARSINTRAALYNPTDKLLTA